MRDWSAAAKDGTLKWLESVTKEKPAVQEDRALARHQATLENCVASCATCPMGWICVSHDFREPARTHVASAAAYSNVHDEDASEANEEACGRLEQ